MNKQLLIIFGAIIVVIFYFCVTKKQYEGYQEPDIPTLVNAYKSYVQEIDYRVFGGLDVTRQQQTLENIKTALISAIQNYLESRSSNSVRPLVRENVLQLLDFILKESVDSFNFPEIEKYYDLIILVDNLTPRKFTIGQQKRYPEVIISLEAFYENRAEIIDESLERLPSDLVNIVKKYLN
jgi:hypothetical protein